MIRMIKTTRLHSPSPFSTSRSDQLHFISAKVCVYVCVSVSECELVSVCVFEAVCCDKGCILCNKVKYVSASEGKEWGGWDEGVGARGWVWV